MRTCSHIGRRLMALMVEPELCPGPMHWSAIVLNNQLWTAAACPADRDIYIYSQTLDCDRGCTGIVSAKVAAFPAAAFSYCGETMKQSRDEALMAAINIEVDRLRARIARTADVRSIAERLSQLHPHRSAEEIGRRIMMVLQACGIPWGQDPPD